MWIRGLPHSGGIAGEANIGSPVVGGTTGSVLFVDGSGNLGQDNANFFWDDTNNRLGIGTSSPAATLSVTQPVVTSGSPNALRVVGGAHTTLAASTEAIDANFNFARTVQFATGALTTQRATVFQAPTYGFVGASTLTNAATVAITAAPTAGTNATITNSWALWVQAGTARFDGSSLAIDVAQTAATSGSPFSVRVTGGAHTTLANAALVDVSFALARTVQFTGAAGSTTIASARGVSITPPTYATAGAGSFTITEAATLYVSGPPVGSGVTLTDAFVIAGAPNTLSAFAFGNMCVSTATGTSTHMLISNYAVRNTSTAWSFQATVSGETYVNTAAGGIHFAVSGTPIWDINMNNGGLGTGHFFPNTDDAYDIGVIYGGTTNLYPRNLTLTRLITAGPSPAAGVVSGFRCAQANVSTNSEVVGFQAATFTQTISAGITTLRFHQLAAPTITAGSAQTVTNAATFSISNAPIAAGSATLTNTWAMWIQAGTARFDGSSLAIDVAQTVATTGSPTAVRVTGGAHTTLTASTEAIDVNFNLARTVQFATGALTTQRGVVFQAPTYGFVGASTLTNAATVAITAAPTAGTNATLTNSWAFWVQAGTARFDGSSLAIDVAQTVATSGSPTAVRVTGGAHTTLTASTEAIDVNVNLARTVQFATGALTTQRAYLVQRPTYGFVGASTLTYAATFSVDGPPIAGTNATLTNTYTIGLGAGINQSVGVIASSGTNQSGASLTIVASRGTGSGTAGYIDFNGSTAIAASGATQHDTATFFRVGNPQSSSVGTTGAFTSCVANTHTDFATAVSGTAAATTAYSWGQPTFAANNTSVVTTRAINCFIAGAPIAGTNETFTTVFALQVGGAVNTGGTSAGFIYRAIDVPAHTLTVTGTTGVSSVGPSVLGLGTLTITDASAVTIDQATGLYIAGAPTAAGSVTITSGAAIRIDQPSIASNSLVAGIIVETFTQTITAGFSTAYFNQFNAPTVTSVGATTSSNLATVYISGAPIAAGAAVLDATNCALLVASGLTALGGRLYVNGSGLGTGPTANFFATIIEGAATSGSPRCLQVNSAAHTTLSASAEATAIDFDLSLGVEFATGALTTQRAMRIEGPTYAFVGASTLTTATTLAVLMAPRAGTNATITASYALQAGATATIGPTSAGFLYAAINVPTHTITVTGTTGVTSVGPAMMSLGTLTISDASAVTVNTAATLYIAGAPTAGGSVTLTAAYPIWIDSGTPRIDSTSANGSVATVLGSVGPVGSNTTVQEWLTINIGGNVRYIPCF